MEIRFKEKCTEARNALWVITCNNYQKTLPEFQNHVCVQSISYLAMQISVIVKNNKLYLICACILMHMCTKKSIIAQIKNKRWKCNFFYFNFHCIWPLLAFSQITIFRILFVVQILFLCESCYSISSYIWPYSIRNTVYFFQHCICFHLSSKWFTC